MDFYGYFHSSYPQAADMPNEVEEFTTWVLSVVRFFEGYIFTTNKALCNFYHEFGRLEDYP